MSNDARGIYISRIYGKQSVGFEQLTVDDTAGGIALTASKYKGALSATITVENADIRFRIDGGSPTATLGHLL